MEICGESPHSIVDSISATIASSYDTLNRVTSDAAPQGTISYTYDAANRRTSMTARTTDTDPTQANQKNGLGMKY